MYYNRCDIPWLIPCWFTMLIVAVVLNSLTLGSSFGRWTLSHARSPPFSITNISVSVMRVVLCNSILWLFKSFVICNVWILDLICPLPLQDLKLDKLHWNFLPYFAKVLYLLARYGIFLEISAQNLISFSKIIIYYCCLTISQRSMVACIHGLLLARFSRHRCAFVVPFEIRRR